MGVTVASCFRTSLALNMDLRFPAARFACARGLRTRFAPLVAAGIAWSFLRRLRPVPWDDALRAPEANEAALQGGFVPGEID